VGLHLWYRAEVNATAFASRKSHATIDSLERILNHSAVVSMVEHIEAGFAVRAIGDQIRGASPSTTTTADHNYQKNAKIEYDDRRRATSSSPNDPFYPSYQDHYGAVNIDQVSARFVVGWE
jgi:hypothetical protein